MKTCKKCLKELPISAFYVHKAMGDGRLSFCKDCVRARVKVHRDVHIDRIREYDRIRGFRVYNPDKARARQLVYNAVRRGELKKEPCWCGAKGEAHHGDYSKPLEVVWLCRKHHGEAHVRVNERLIAEGRRPWAEA